MCWGHQSESQLDRGDYLCESVLRNVGWRGGGAVGIFGCCRAPELTGQRVSLYRPRRFDILGGGDVAKARATLPLLSVPPGLGGPSPNLHRLHLVETGPPYSIAKFLREDGDAECLALERHPNIERADRGDRHIGRFTLHC
jgi:hypothetical protein